MKALVMTAPGTLDLQSVPVPAQAGECLVRVRMAGICGTDLQLLDGYAGFSGVPGHEFVGMVESTDDAADASDASLTGSRVVGEINIGCGRCAWCARGVKEHCENRTVLGIRDHDGAFAEFLTLPAGNLHVLPDAINDEAAVFVEPAAAACRILEQIVVEHGARVAVLGDGRMGLLVAQVLRTATPDVTVFGRHERKLSVAESLGLTTERAGGSMSGRPDRFDIVVDVTGRPDGIGRALELVRPRGTIVLKSTFHGEAPIVSWPIVVDEVTLVGSRCGPFRTAIELLAAGAIQVKPLVSRVFELRDHAAAFAEARTALKVLFAVR